MAEMDRRKKQYIALALLGGAVIGGTVLVGELIKPDSTPGLSTSSQPTIDETIIADRSSAASPELTFVRQGLAQITALKEELEEQRKLFDQSRLQAQREAEKSRQENEEVFLQMAGRIEAQAKELESLKGQVGSGPIQSGDVVPSAREQLLRRQAQEGPGSDFIERRTPSRRNATTQGQQPAGTGDAIGQGSGFGQSFTLASVKSAEEEAREIKTLSNYLPAGSYAPAVVLSGADAATNVSNRENPIPVIFRITGPAITAAVGHTSPARVNLKGCTVQGSATGDISSERVKVRLITMTCINRAGQVLETKVAGYMSGSGKEGVRGHVTSRAGPQVKAATIAGAIGGLGSGFSSAATAGIYNENASASQILKGAGLGTLSGGLEGAANTLAEYHIKRAEQYQPVVSLYGGTKVELVFLEGVELGS